MAIGNTELQIARSVFDFWMQVERGPDDACWRWRGLSDDRGYGLFFFGGRRYGAHELALTFSTGWQRGDRETRHLCHSPSCCNPAHLAFGSRSQNRQDSRLAGRLMGVNATLTLEQVVAIRTRRAAGESVTALAAEFGVHRPAITRICSGERWSFAPGPLTPARRRLSRSKS